MRPTIAGVTNPSVPYPILASLDGPAALHDMDDVERAALAEEMRRAIIATVSRTGGHLGSSLGAIELTIALHSELQSPRDRILWDVGHQAYGHKLLTGRLGEFATLRQHHGLSGFLRREESEHDVMGAGHASTSISYAVGLAEAMRVAGRRDRRIVAVIGDGAMTGGMAYEALNHAGHLQSPLTVVLNDNGMSISQNVGAVAGMLQRARLDPMFTRVRHEIERGLGHVPGIIHLGASLSNATKALFVPGQLFEALGFMYLGPIDGHDIPALRTAIKRTGDINRPVFLHVHTQKGRGYGPAEEDGEAMHGSGPFAADSGRAARPSVAPSLSYTEVFGRALVAEADNDPRVVGITAAMLKGTGLNHMLDRFPERTYDVGIAEQHGVVFAAGLAIAGYRPVCAVYSTFLQRAFDPIIHDVALQGLPVVFAIDRGGLVGDDGPTHHGCFDIAYLRPIPGMTVMAPMDEAELVHMLHTALRLDGPSAFRYPRGSGTGVPLPEVPEVLTVGKGVILEEGAQVALVGYGYGVQVAQEAAAIVSESLGVRPTVVNARFVKPIDEDLLRDIASRHDVIVTIEDHALEGGFGSAVREVIGDGPARIESVGLPDRFISHGRREILLAEAGVTAAATAAAALAALSDLSPR
ncbi:MAG: 1-deoxy-D-xylulose-5-phosphate synthase [Thermoleophilia bacterium]|nr:1-deoxy-D-xylulose-5-phosphate synthase [Thermoleophilia bacterium]